MKKLVMALVVLLFGVLTVECRSLVPVQNIEHQTVPVHDKQKVEQAIIAGGMRAKAWQISKEKDGLFIGTFIIRTHKAVVEIPYNKDEYSIIYKSSENLRYNSKKNLIHPRYNKMVLNLSRLINQALLQQQL